jgi:hypothetical protein
VGAKLVKRPRPKAFEMRHMEGFPSLSNIRNKDDNRKYVLANKMLGENAGGVEYYESIGYRIEHKSKDGPRFSGFNSRDQKEGDVLERRELVLMSIAKTSSDEREMTAELIERYGPRGDTGLQRFDDLMAHISDNDPSSGFNPLRNTNLGNSQHFYPISGNKLEEGIIVPKG